MLGSAHEFEVNAERVAAPRHQKSTTKVLAAPVDDNASRTALLSGQKRSRDNNPSTQSVRPVEQPDAGGSEAGVPALPASSSARVQVAATAASATMLTLAKIRAGVSRPIGELSALARAAGRPLGVPLPPTRSVMSGAHAVVTAAVTVTSDDEDCANSGNLFV